MSGSKENRLEVFDTTQELHELWAYCLTTDRFDEVVFKEFADAPLLPYGVTSRPQPTMNECASAGAVFYIEEIQITDPAYTRMGIGRLLLHQIIENKAKSCFDNIVLMPGILTRPLTKYEDLYPEPSAKRRGGPRAAPENEMKKLVRVFKSVTGLPAIAGNAIFRATLSAGSPDLGFRQIGDTDYFGLANAYRRPEPAEFCSLIRTRGGAMPTIEIDDDPEGPRTSEDPPFDSSDEEESAPDSADEQSTTVPDSETGDSVESTSVVIAS